MHMKIVCFILLLTSINFAAPTCKNESAESCCERISKEESLGPGIDNTIITVDVGECQLSKECGEGEECKPSHTSYRTYHLYNGTITKEIIKQCTCQEEPSNNCTRLKRFTTYFEGSSFEQKIDTGECVGVFQAAKGKQCIAIENRTEVISGPNGRICVPAIKLCEFHNSCYLAPLKEQHLEIYKDEYGKTKQRWKTINVGQCKGYCEPKDVNCELKILQGGCFLTYDRNCVPTNYTTETFNSSPEEVKKILTITECGCK